MTPNPALSGAIDFSALHLHPVIFQIGPFALRWYSLSYISGILCGWLYLRCLLTKSGAPMSRDHADGLIGWATVGILLGGRLAYVIFYDPMVYLGHPFFILKLWEGGMSFHGGMVGTAIAIVLFARANGLQWLRVTDYIAMCAPFGLFFGRLANFVNGELWGRPTGMPWGVIFPAAGPIPRHPSQIYEALLEGPLLFVLLWCIFRFSAARWQAGRLSGAFLLSYGLFRFLIEYVREPDQQLVALAAYSGLHMGQWLSLPMIAGGAYLVMSAPGRSLPGRFASDDRPPH